MREVVVACRDSSCVHYPNISMDEEDNSKCVYFIGDGQFSGETRAGRGDAAEDKLLSSETAGS
jgi:hypothetical protein